VTRKGSLQISEQQLGADHPDTAINLLNLAALYYSLDRLEEAKPLITRTVAIFDHTLGQDHPNTISAHQWWQAIHNPKQA